MQGEQKGETNRLEKRQKGIVSWIKIYDAVAMPQSMNEYSQLM